MTELKPCPFCGSRAVVKLRSYGTYNTNGASLIRFEIRCEKCNATRDRAYGEVYIRLLDTWELDAYHDDRESAIEAWNGRADA